MELRPHQQKALDNVNEIFAEDNKAIVVHPTGAGKTYIALELFRQNKDKKMVFVAPLSEIIWQFKLAISKEFGVKPEEYKKVFPNLEFTTYQQINSDFKKSETYAQDFDADLVVFDEAHHTAAPGWGKNAKDLMSIHPETKFLGLTATPQRPDGKDVTKDVFDGNLADEITLEEAVATRLLKMPNYVTSLYSYEPIIEELEAGLEAIKDKYPEKYLMRKKDMEVAKNMLEKSHGLPEIFAEHMVKKNGKYIVFCKDINHLNEMVETAKTQGWFDGVNENVEILAIHSEEDDKTNKSVLKRFRESHVATDNTLRILFSVEKINEGLHLDDIDGEIMLRPTKSKIIYRQQLGRVMAITLKNGRAVVFDVVNNIDSFQDLHDFMEKVIQIRIANEPDRDPEEIRKEAFDEFYMYDETREPREILRKVAGELEEEWEDFYQRSVKWRQEHNGKGPRSTTKDKNENVIYSWERAQKLRYLRDYQDLDEQEIPEEYREKVKKLKDLGMKYVPYEYKTAEETFQLWEAWTLENNVCPSSNSKDDEERKIAQGMRNALITFKKYPGKYKEILEKYELLKKQYSRRKDDKTPEEHFAVWKSWTLDQGVTPSQTSQDELERKIATNMNHTVQRMKKKPEKYQEILNEYEKILQNYGRKKDNKTAIQNYELWKEWTLKHNATPSQNADNEEEKTIAKRMNYSLTSMKKSPEKYANILEEYEKLKVKFQRDTRAAEKYYEAWRDWVLEHSITPNRRSEDNDEKKVAQGMVNGLKIMRQNEDYFKNILEEYEALCAQYGRRKDDKTPIQTFKLWKEWTLEHGITPSQNSQDELEKRIATNMAGVLARIDKDCENSSTILEEYEALCTQYGRRKDDKTPIQTFELWKEWTLEHKATPRGSAHMDKNSDEYKIARSFSNVLVRMKKEPEKYRKILEEYEALYAQYGRRKDDQTPKEHFMAWKQWTIEHGITPLQKAHNEEERRVSRRMSETLRKIKKNPEQYMEIIEEYESLCAQYGRRKDDQTPEEHFVVWKKWTIEHQITPSQTSKDEMERKIAKNMNSAQTAMKKDPEKYTTMLEEYRNLCLQYSRRKLKPLQQQKEQELAETRELKLQSEQAENLDAQTQAALDHAIDEQSQKPKGPGE